MPEIRVVIPDKLEKILDSLIHNGIAGNRAELVRIALAEYIASSINNNAIDFESSNTISPDGRIIQIEYAFEATKKGGLSIGINYENGLVLMKNRQIKGLNPSLLNLNSSFRKMYLLNEKIGIFSVGIGPDADNILYDLVENIEKSNFIYHENIIKLVQYISHQIHSTTIDKNKRPIAASFLIGGLSNDEKIHLFSIDPSGMVLDLNAYAIGNSEDTAKEILSMGISTVKSRDDAIMLGMEALGPDVNRVEDIEIQIIEKKTKKFVEIDENEKNRLFNLLKS